METNHWQPYPWTRRARCYIAITKTARRFRGWLLGTNGIPNESENYSAAMSFHGQSNSGEPTATTLWACPICAAYVQEPNRDYHYKWHVTGVR